MVMTCIERLLTVLRRGTGAGEPDLKALKNANINANLKVFLKSREGRALPPRESALDPEILIPCYNHGDCLEGALASVTPSHHPVTVIDDASSDGHTPAQIRDLATRFHFRTLRNEQNLLQGGSINRAVKESHANLFIVLNADDVLLPYTVDLLIGIFKDYPAVRLAGGSSIWFHNDETIRLAKYFPERLDYKPRTRLYTPEEALRFTRLNDINMTQSGCAFLRSAWEGAGGFLPFSERVCSHDDRDFQMRVAALFPVAVVDEPVAFYRLGRSSKKGQQ